MGISRHSKAGCWGDSGRCNLKFVELLMTCLTRRQNRSFGWKLALATVVFLAGGSISRASDKSIFDDDWSSPSQKKPVTPTPAVVKPPAPVTPPAPAPVAPPPVTPSPVTPGPLTPPPRPAPITPPPLAPQPPRPAIPAPAVPAGTITRQVIPPTTRLDTSRKLLKEAFAKQLADKSPKARNQLSITLLDEALKANSDASDQYVLFSGALNCAREAGNLRQVSLVAQKFAASFPVDQNLLLINAASGMSLKADTTSRTNENVTLALELVDTLVTQGDLIGAARLCAAMRPAAAADKTLMATVTRRAQEIDALRIAKERIAPSLTKLAENPSDPAANSAVGAYNCFSLGNWNEGLPMLAKGSDPATKLLAATELAQPKTAVEQLALADGWWGISERQVGPSQVTVQRHAVSWYYAAREGLSPLQKLKIDKHIAELAAKEGPAAMAAIAAQQNYARLKAYRSQLWTEAGTDRTPLAVEQPVGGEISWPGKAGAYSLADKVRIGRDADKQKNVSRADGTIHVGPGFIAEGGNILVAHGVLDIAGDPARPAVFRKTHFVVELGGHIKASNAVFDECSFGKGGGWFVDSFSAKFEFSRCLLIETKFENLNRVDMGFRFNGCSIVDCRLPSRGSDSKHDSYKVSTSDWSRIRDCDFYNCDIHASVVWCMNQCNFSACRITEKDTDYHAESNLTITLGIPRQESAQLLADLAARTKCSEKGQVSFDVAQNPYSHQAFSPP